MITPTRELRWVQPKWSRRCYELIDGDQVIAKLEYRTWKSVPYITLDNEELVIRARNFWQSKLGVMRGEQEIALYQRGNWGKGEVTFISGRRFVWQRKSTWSTTYMFTAADNEELITFKTVARLARSEAKLTLSPSSEKYPEMRILMAFGWYLMMAAAKAGTT